MRHPILCIIVVLLASNWTFAQEAEQKLTASMRFRIRNDAPFNFSSDGGFRGPSGGGFLSGGGGGRGGGMFGGEAQIENGPRVRLEQSGGSDAFSEWQIGLDSVGMSPVDPEKFRQFAKERFDEYAQSLKKIAESAQNRQDESYARLAASVASTTDKMTVLQQQLQQNEKESADRGFSADRETLSKFLVDLQQQRQRLELESVGLKARQEAIGTQLAILAKKSEAGLVADPVAGELRKVVAAREQQFDLARGQVQSGRFSQAEVDNAAIAVAEAKARLAERVEATQSSAGGELMSQLNADLVRLSIDSAAVEAQFKTISERVEQGTMMLGNSHRSEEFRAALVEHRDQRATLQKRLDSAEEQRGKYSAHPPFEILETTFPPENPPAP